MVDYSTSKTQEYLLVLKEDKTIDDIKTEVDKFVAKRINDTLKKHIKDYEVTFFFDLMQSRNMDRESLATKLYESKMISLEPQAFLKKVDSEFDNAIKLTRDEVIKKASVRIAIPYSDVKEENYCKIKDVMEYLQNYFDKDLVFAEFSSTKANLDKESMENLLKLNGEIRIEFDSCFFVDELTLENEKLHTITLNDVISAEIKANDFIDKLKALHLSPFENFLLIHDFCANKAYKLDPKSEYDCRHFVDCMNSDQIVCAGYAKMMQKLCQKIGIECEYIARADLRPQKDIKDAMGNKVRLFSEGHAFNMLKIKDEKYNIDGIYLCDACWDCIVNGKINYFYASLPIQDIRYDSHCIYIDLDKDKDFNEKYPKSSRNIPYETYRQALFTAYGALNDSNVTKEVLEDRLKYTVRKAKVYHDKMDNYFSRKRVELIKNNNEQSR